MIENNFEEIAHYENTQNEANPAGDMKFKPVSTLVTGRHSRLRECFQINFIISGGPARPLPAGQYEEEEHPDPAGPVLHRLHHSQRHRDGPLRPGPGADSEAVQDQTGEWQPPDIQGGFLTNSFIIH